MKEPFALLHGNPVHFSDLPLWAIQRIAAGDVTYSQKSYGEEGVGKGFAQSYAAILLRERGL